MTAGAPTRGRLGQTDYELGPDRVLVRRSWRLVVLVPLLPLGIAVVAVAISTATSESQDPVPVIVAVILATLMMVAGIAGAVSVPWFPPRTITCTPRGIVSDGVEIPAADVATITIHQVVRRFKGNTAYAYFLVITMTTGHRKRMELCESRSAEEPVIVQIAQAMTRLMRS